MHDREVSVTTATTTTATMRRTVTMARARSHEIPIFVSVVAHSEMSLDVVHGNTSHHRLRGGA